MKVVFETVTGILSRMIATMFLYKDFGKLKEFLYAYNFVCSLYHPGYQMNNLSVSFSGWGITRNHKNPCLLNKEAGEAEEFHSGSRNCGLYVTSGQGYYCYPVSTC